MLPIGMAKDQKRKTGLIKNLLNECYDSVSPIYINSRLSTEGNQNKNQNQNQNQNLIQIQIKNKLKSSLNEDKKLSNNNQVKYLINLYFLGKEI
jgi:hypothetical protein